MRASDRSGDGLSRIRQATGLIHFGARDYDPSSGGWMQQDPAGYINGSNLYQFVESNPVKFIDPTGLAFMSPFGPGSNGGGGDGGGGSDGGGAGGDDGSGGGSDGGGLGDDGGFGPTPEPSPDPDLIDLISPLLICEGPNTDPLLFNDGGPSMPIVPLEPIDIPTPPDGIPTSPPGPGSPNDEPDPNLNLDNDARNHEYDGQ